jgi:carboxypeptidase Taq
MSTVTPAYDRLTGTWTRLHRLGHLQSIAGWDQAANMPAKGNEARAAAMAEMATLLHRMHTDPALKSGLEQAAAEPLDEVQRANLREMRRQWRDANALPESLVERADAGHGALRARLAQQRPANDWHGFLENFRPVLALAREEAALLSELTGLSRYDALMDRYEPGMTSAAGRARLRRCARVAAGIDPRACAKAERDETADAAGRAVPVGRAARAVRAVMELLGFDFEAGRLDVSTHPFCGGVPEDVRLTTRFTRTTSCAA